MARRAAPAVVGLPTPGAPEPRTWREAYSAAKGLEVQLRNFTERANGQVRMLDRLFTEQDLRGLPPIPRIQEKAPLTVADHIGSQKRNTKKRYNKDGTPIVDNFGDVMELTKGIFDKAEGVRNLMEQPPILSFETLLKRKVMGKLSSVSEMSLPARVYPVQLTAGAKDDPVASAEENRRWNEALGLTTETIEQLWPAAEAAQAAVAVAEQRAAARRPKPIADFRKRVMELLVFAHNHPSVDRAELDLETWLEKLATDPAFLPQLARLEEAALDVEGCRAELRLRRQEANKFAQDTDAYRRKMKRVAALEDRLAQATFDLRTFCEFAKIQIETDAAYKEIGDVLSKLNPFR